jgi:hypothetical protein
MEFAKISFLTISDFWRWVRLDGIGQNIIFDKFGILAVDMFSFCHWQVGERAPRRRQSSVCVTTPN